MRTIGAVIAAIAFASIAAQGQGQFLFNTHDNSAGNTVRFECLGEPLSGADLFVEVLAGPDAQHLIPLTPLLPLNRTGAGAGYTDPFAEIYTVPGMAGGSRATVAYRAFKGLSYATATATLPLAIAKSPVTLTEPPSPPTNEVDLGVQSEFCMLNGWQVPGQIPLGVALDAPELVWETGGNLSWFGQAGVSLHGKSSAQSPPIDSGEAWLSTRVLGPGLIEFDWKVESPGCGNQIWFYVGDSLQLQIYRSESTNWVHGLLDLPEGTNTLTWRYGSACVEGRGWVDRVRYQPGGVPPYIPEQTTNQTTYVDGRACFNVFPRGTGTPSYQWQFMETNLTGETLPSLFLPKVDFVNAGQYRCVVSNNFGAITSQVAQLTVIPAIPLKDALKTPDWKWVNTSCDASWFGQSEVALAGEPTVQSSADQDGELAQLETRVIGPGTLSFSWLLRPEAVGESLQFWDDDGHQIRCDEMWDAFREQVVYIGAGEKALHWLHYAAVAFEAIPKARAWLGPMHWKPGGTEPILQQQPSSATVFETTVARLSVGVEGTPPIHYQWLHNDTPIPASDTNRLTVSTVQPVDEGRYRVVVWNDWGTNTSQTVDLTVKPVPPGPKLVFTAVPEFNSTDWLEGMAFHVAPQDYRVAVYIKVWGTWRTKTLWAEPLTAIQADGSWRCNINTSVGNDPKATAIAAFLVQADFSPSLGTGQDSLESLEKNPYQFAIDWCIATRSPSSLRFSGLDWFLKSGTWGPDNNHFSDHPSNVWVDDRGRLHLKISRRVSWWCPEVICGKSLGYGTYRFYLDSPVDNFASNVVFGLFTWSDLHDYAHREMDLEFSRWNEGQDAPNAQYVVQPWSMTGHRVRFNWPQGVTSSVHSLTWEPSQIWFASTAGDDAASGAGFGTNYLFSVAGDVAKSGDENPRINLWLIGGQPPSDGHEVEVIVRKFEFIPHLTVSRERVVTLGLTGVPGSKYMVHESTDLRSWRLWSAVSLSSSSQSIELNDGQEPARFFRLEMP